MSEKNAKNKKLEAQVETLKAQVKQLQEIVKKEAIRSRQVEDGLGHMNVRVDFAYFFALTIATLELDQDICDAIVQDLMNRPHHGLTAEQVIQLYQPHLSILNEMRVERDGFKETVMKQ